MSENHTYRQQLSDLGLCRGDVVLVHSSMKAMRTERTPEEVIGDMQAVISEEGTLLMPALTYENVTPENPVFDSELTQPCIGLLPETFWRMPELSTVRCSPQRESHTLGMRVGKSCPYPYCGTQNG